MLLRIGYSPLHPYFRPAVAAPKTNFERHQNPLSHELCLLTQESGQWDSNQPVAEFIQEQLDQLLQALAARKEGHWEHAAKLEEPVADPLMPYFVAFAEDDSGKAPLPSHQHGLMEVVCTNRTSESNPMAFEGVLRQLRASTGAPVGKRFAFPVDEKNAQTITGRWVKFTPPPTTNAGELLRAAEEELARQAVLQAPSVRKINEIAQGPFSLTGIVFPEETEYGSPKKGAGWLFLATRYELASGKRVVSEARLILSERAAQDDVLSRLPIAKSLLTKKVLVVGCGAIGSFAGLELARAGVGEIALIDFDTVQPGNSLRWPIGRPAWGSSKATALAAFIAQNYPWTKPSVGKIRLGAAFTDSTGIPRDWGNILAPFLKALRAADVVVDASASSEVQLALSYYCRKFHVPYVVGYATLGVAGGVVARFLPDSNGCFICLQEHWKDTNIPEPRVDDTGIVVPVGCNAPTFTGGSFDLQEISLEIIRTAVGLISEGNYDPGGWQIAILTLKDKGGARVLPHWEAHQCSPHPNCCGAGR
jgi:molybdopterin/thiamine biosynthesis adenylyltransferase